MAASQQSSPRRLWRISLRACLVGFALIGAAVGLFANAAFDLFATSEQLYDRFVATNPSSLAGWSVSQPGPERRWLTWSRRGIAYRDTNNDGRPDMKIREYPVRSTTRIWWEDTDFDGQFDTEVEQGCFHHQTRPLKKTIPVPTVLRDEVR